MFWPAFCIAILVFWPFPAQALVVTEIAYDRPGADDKREWLEIYNDTSEPVDLTGHYFHDGSFHQVRQVADQSLTLLAGHYGVLVDDPTTFRVDYPAYGGWLAQSVMSLPNQSTTDKVPAVLQIANQDKQSIVSLTYRGTKKGEIGYTLSWQDENGWIDSAAVNGSPGQPNPPPVKQDYSRAIYLNEIMVNPDGPDTDHEWVELVNLSDQAVDLGGWSIIDKAAASGSQSRRIIPSQTVIGPGGLFVFALSGSILNNSDEEVTLSWPDDTPIETVRLPEKMAEGASYGLMQSIWEVLQSTPGQANQRPVASPTPSLTPPSTSSSSLAGPVGSPVPRSLPSAASAILAASPAIRYQDKQVLPTESVGVTVLRHTVPASPSLKPPSKSRIAGVTSEQTGLKPLWARLGLVALIGLSVVLYWYRRQLMAWLGHCQQKIRQRSLIT